MKEFTLAQILTVNLYLILLFFIPLFVSPANPSSLSKGSQISVENFKTDFLYSPDKSFACGFYNIATNSFVFAIWFVNSVNNTIAWTANRDQPVNGHGSKITMQKDGNLVLMDVGSATVWSTNTSFTGAQTVELLNNGNLVVNDSNGEVLWQSFDSPTDTLLPLQLMTKHTTLVSASPVDLLSSGYYKFYFDSNNNLGLVYVGDPNILNNYWPVSVFVVASNYNISKIGVLDNKGHFTASDQQDFKTSDFGTKIKRRLTLDYDGNLRVYSLNESNGDWSVSWQAVARSCEIRGKCGPNGVCFYTQSKAECSCPHGFEMNDPENWSKGCRRMPGYKLGNDQISSNRQQVKFVEFKHIDFYGYEFISSLRSYSFRECRSLCINLSSCEAFVYKSGSGECYPKSALFNGRVSENYNTYMKYPRNANFSQFSESLQGAALVCNSVAKEQPSSNLSYMRNGGKTKWAYFYWFSFVFFVLEAFFILFGWWFLFRKDQKPTSNDENFNALSSHFRRFSYAELRKATRNFADVAGIGSSGTVYKGVLDDDKVVAVKKLENVIQGEEELQVELSLIGRINHKNLVRMIGFCSEQSKRLLVSEFVEHGSLDKGLFDGDETNVVLKWSERYKLALGVAQGLAYLHHECLEWVIHCDVKPENILLDKDFEPKIADFGLAKLLNRNANGSNLSRIRGTRGYIAPEWASSLPITGKVDVYSYGVVLLELVKGSRVSTWVVEGEDNVEMVLKSSLLVLQDKLKAEEQNWIDDYIDFRLNGQFNKIQVVVLLKIAISCLEEERSKRPNMNSVFQLLLSYDDHEYN